VNSAPNELSFLPDDYLAGKQRRRTNMICASLFSVVVLAIGGAFSFTERSVRSVERDHAQIQAKYAEAAVRIMQVQRMQEKQKTMARQAELTASLLERVPRSFLLAEITNNMPTGTSLLDIGLESKPHSDATTAFDKRKAEVDAANGKAAATVKQLDILVRITGVAASNLQVAQFLARLNQSKLLTDVKLVISDEYAQGEEKLRRFQMEANLNPAAQVQPGNGDSRTAVVELSSAK
jgi:Tfp pilus assembly protein PilN